MASPRLSIPFDDGSVLLPDDGVVAIFRAQPFSDAFIFPKERTRFTQTFKPSRERLIQMGLEPLDEAETDVAISVVQLTRSKAESLCLIAQAYAATGVGGIVMVDGAKTDGVDSILKRCKAATTVKGSIPKSHGRVFWFERTKEIPEAFDTWLKDGALKPNSAGFHTAPGMFSPEKIDLGSEFLANAFAGKLKGQVADLGAGWGWLSTQALKAPEVSSITLVEAEQLAIDAAQANITDPRATFMWEDVTALNAPQKFDAVIANPPFHQSRAAEPALGIAFIAKAAEILKASGTLWLVANRQLPYEQALETGFAHFECVQQERGFKIFRATRPKSRSARQVTRNRVT